MMLHAVKSMPWWVRAAPSGTKGRWHCQVKSISVVTNDPRGHALKFFSCFGYFRVKLQSSALRWCRALFSTKKIPVNPMNCICFISHDRRILLYEHPSTPIKCRRSHFMINVIPSAVFFSCMFAALNPLHSSNWNDFSYVWHILRWLFCMTPVCVK